MRKSFQKTLPFSIALMVCVSVEGLLPPLYESLTEYRSLINNTELAKYLNSAEYINDIERTSTGFRIVTNRQSLEVEIVYEQTIHPGPAKFHFIFNKKNSF